VGIAGIALHLANAEVDEFVGGGELQLVLDVKAADFDGLDAEVLSPWPTSRRISNSRSETLSTPDEESSDRALEKLSRIRGEVLGLRNLNRRGRCGFHQFLVAACFMT
jgi:hypothetical protein